VDIVGGAARGADPVDHRLSADVGAPGHDDVRALVAEGDGDGPADVAGGSGDEGGPGVESGSHARKVRT